MARKEFLDYIFKYAIEPQLGYSFSINHTLPYSVIAIQEANLATRWNPLYWQCACLCVNAGNYAGDVNGEDDGEDTALEDEGKKAKKSAPNYGKIAKAISAAQAEGVKIELPDINTSQADFVPDIKNNAILYSLKAVNVVSDDLFDRVVANRPYTGAGDFYRRVAPTQTQMIGLIKAGCFDALCGKPRGFIMDSFLRYLSKQEIEEKDKMTTVQLKKAVELKMPILDSYKDMVRLYWFKQYIDTNQTDKPNKRYILAEEDCVDYFNSFVKKDLSPLKDEYSFLPGGKISIKIAAFKKVYDKKTLPLMEYLNSEEGKKKYTEILRDSFVQGLKEKYCAGSVSKWEMDTMSFYYSGHELLSVNKAMYNIKDFKDLPEYVDEGAPLCSIAGTIVDTDNTKHIVTVLTTNGIVDIKLYTNSYAVYNQKISDIDSKTKKKTVVDDSWLKRGNKIIAWGQRRENMFVAKNNRAIGFNRTIGLIEGIHADGTLSIRYTRNKKRGA